MALAYSYAALYPAGAASAPQVGVTVTQADPGSTYDSVYTSMSALEAGENADLSVGDGTVLRAEIIDPDGDSDWSGNPDTTSVTFDGWATDRDGDGSYVSFKSYGTARSSTGAFDATAYILQITSTNTQTVSIDNDASATDFLDIEFDGVQFEHVDGGANDGATNMFIVANAYHKRIEFKKCYFLQDTSDTDYNIEQWCNNANLRLLFQNCIIENGSKGIYLENLDSTAFARIYNCTISECTEGIDFNNEQGGVCKNTAVFNNGDDFVDITNVTFDYDATDDGDGTSNEVDISPAGDGGEAISWAKVFTDYANGDFTVKDTNSYIYLASEITQTDDSYVPSDDIADNSRNTGAGQQVCIGAYEYTSATTTLTVPGVRHVHNSAGGSGAGAGALVLQKHSTLLVPDVRHEHRVAAFVLSKLVSLDVRNPRHVHHYAGVPTPSVGALVSLTDARHAHVAQRVTLQKLATLATVGARHDHRADSFAFSVLRALSVPDARHEHRGEVPSAGRTRSMSLPDARQVHTAGVTAPERNRRMDLPGARHIHRVGIPSPTAVPSTTVMSVTAARHVHRTGVPRLSKLHTLFVPDTRHVHSAGVLSLTVAGGPTESVRVFSASSSPFVFGAESDTYVQSARVGAYAYPAKGDNDG